MLCRMGTQQKRSGKYPFIRGWHDGCQDFMRSGPLYMQNQFDKTIINLLFE